MPNGEMQLIAYGSQDIYLTGNPTITFFKYLYKRHTNFATEYIRQDFERLPNFNTENQTKVKCKINRNGDLISDIYLVYDLPDIYSGPKMSISTTDPNTITRATTDVDYFRWINNLGENIINTVELLIDGQIIDSQYGIWMNIWNELTISKSKRESYDMMIGNNSMLTNPSLYNGPYTGKSSLGDNNQPTINANRLYIPLPFWFCNNPGLAIPLIALQYNELYVYIEFNQLNDLFTVGTPAVSPKAIFDTEYLNEYGANYETNIVGLGNPNNLNLSTDLTSNGYSKSNLFYKYINGTKDNNSSWKQNCYLDVNYIFLDKDERNKFANISHEYLITQVQQNHFLLNNNTSESISGSKNTLNLLFNHPVKELVWVVRRTDVDKRNQWNNYTISTYDYDLYDSNNYLKRNYNSIIPSSNLSDPNNYHSVKIFNILNYSQGKNSGFTNNTTIKDASVNPYYDVNDFTHRNSDCFNNINNIMYSAKLIFNGNDRFSIKDNNFFNYLQPYKYHTNTPSSGVNTYSFALNPEDSQPSGTCNVSRLNSLQLDINTRSINSNTTYDFGYEIFVFALNINVLRIMGGIGGLVFAN